MLMVLDPLALIFLTVKEGKDAIALAFALLIVAFINIAVSPGGSSLAMGLASLQFSFVVSAIAGFTGAKIDFLSSNRQCQADDKY